MKRQRLLQLFILLILLFSLIGNSQYAYASVDIGTGPSASTFVKPSYVNIGETAMVFVGLGNVPAEGYAGAEFTCIYDANLLEVSEITGIELFGWNPITVINRPQDGRFIAAIVGSNGRKATSSGAALTFKVKGLRAGRTTINCTARVSKGDNVLLDIPSKGSSFTVIDSAASPVPFTPTVTPNGPTATPMPNVVYDFVANVCSATWFSGTGQLPCSGADWDVKGFVLKLDHPVRETGAIDTRPGLLTAPPNIYGGVIQGSYPPFKVQSGDHFRATIGCEGGATDCYITFRLDYQIGSDPIIENFWGFTEAYDGIDYEADIDLSRLTGEEVRFILSVRSSGPSASDDRALWVAPVIYRTGAVPTVAGQVFAGKPVTVSFYGTDASLIASMSPDADGRFSFTAPIGIYSVCAIAGGSLRACGYFALTLADTHNMQTINLSAGDIDNNNFIDQFDALTIGMNYNSTTPAVADLNNDAIINVLDLELLALNYHKSGPVFWQ